MSHSDSTPPSNPSGPVAGASSVGSIVKRLHALHPELTTQEMIWVVKEAIETRGGDGDFGRLETVNEAKALGLARELSEGKASA